MTPTTYWTGWLLVGAAAAVILYWVIRFAIRHERWRARHFE